MAVYSIHTLGRVFHHQFEYKTRFLLPISICTRDSLATILVLTFSIWQSIALVNPVEQGCKQKKRAEKKPSNLMRVEIGVENNHSIGGLKNVNNKMGCSFKETYEKTKHTFGRRFVSFFARRIA